MLIIYLINKIFKFLFPEKKKNIFLKNKILIKYLKKDIFFEFKMKKIKLFSFSFRNFGQK